MHAITITFPSFVKTFIDSCFHDLVFQDRWSKREVNGIFLFITINEHILLSIASMVSSKVWFFHFPLLFVIATLITHGLLWFGCMLRWDFFFFQCLLVQHLNILCKGHSNPWLLFNPWSKPKPPASGWCVLWPN